MSRRCTRWIPLQKITNNQNAVSRPFPNGQIHKGVLHLSVREYFGCGHTKNMSQRIRKLQLQQPQKLFSQSLTNMTTPNELNKNDSNEHVKLDYKRLMPPRPYTKSHSQMNKAGSGRGGPSQGHNFLVVQCQMSRTVNIHARNIIWTQQVVFRNIHTQTHMTQVCNNN